MSTLDALLGRCEAHEERRLDQVATGSHSRVFARLGVVLGVPACLLLLLLIELGINARPAGAFSYLSPMKKQYEPVLAPASAAQSGDPGATVTYTLVLTNEGNGWDTFTLTVGSTAFTTTVTPSSVGPLSAEASRSVTVTVQIPPGAAAGVSDTATLTATSQGDASQSASSTLTTTVNRVRHVALAPHVATRLGDPGATVTYTLVLTNEGNGWDIFTLTVGSTAFTTTVTPSSVGPLSAGARRRVTVTVQIPMGAGAGGSDAAIITATSQGDASQSASSILTTIVKRVRHVALAPASAAQSGDPGVTVTYTLVLTNTGNAPDTFALTVGSTAFTTTVTPSSVGPLSAEASRSVTVTVQIPAGAGAGVGDTATLTATSQGDASQSASSTLTTTVNRVRHVALAPPAAARSGDPGATVTYALVLTNEGNGADIFTLTVGSTAFTTTVMPSSVGPLSAEASRSVTVTVQIPAGAAAGVSGTATLTATSQGDASQSASSTLTTTAANTARSVYLPLVQKNFFCDQYEPNDNRPTNGGTPWGPLSSGQTIHSQICPGDPRDLYYFNAGGAVRVTIDLTNMPGNADFGLYLWDESGTDFLAGSGKGAGQNKHIIYTLPRAGRYYIDVYPWSGSSGPYTLQGSGW